MRKAFTLIELMISIILLSLIMSFLYQSVAQLQQSNQQFLKKTNSMQKREDILKLLYNDFINASSVQWYDRTGDKDTIVMQSSNSLHDMTQPYLVYRIYKDENTLRRVESPVEKVDLVNKVFRFDDIVTEVKMFKVYENKGHYLVYMNVEGMDDIYLDLVPPSLSSAKLSTTQDNTNENNVTSPN